MDLRNYRLNYRGTLTNAYNRSKIEIRKKKLMVEVEGRLFIPADPMSIVYFLQTPIQACKNLKINQRASLFRFAHFTKEVLSKIQYT